MWTGDEIALIEETAERTWGAIERARAEAAVRESEARLEAKLADATLLQSISAELVHEESEDSLYDRIVEAAMAIMRSQFAVLQRLHPERGSGGELELLAARLHPADRARLDVDRRRARNRRAAARRPCGPRAQMIVRTSSTHAPRWRHADLERYRRTGIAAVQSTPLFARDGQVVGMLSTHWTRPHTPAARDLRQLDILAAPGRGPDRTPPDPGRPARGDRRKDEFLATLAHELRNPLAPLRNCLHILRATRRRRRATAQAARHDGAAGLAHGAAGRRSHGGLAHHARRDRTAQATRQPARRAGIGHRDQPAAAGTGQPPFPSRCHQRAAPRWTPTRCAWRRCSPTCSTTPRSTRRPAATSPCTPTAWAMPRKSASKTTASAWRRRC
jgi:signal transduction histidine kinase